jgi:DNA repair protein RecN (Recombination protein N)
LSENDENVITALKNIENLISAVDKLGVDTKEYQNRMQSAIIEIQDIAEDLNNINSDIEYDADKIEFVNERLNLIFGLHQKFGVNSNEELIKIKEELNGKLANFAIDESKSEKLRKEIAKQKNELLDLAKAISKTRKAKKPDIEKYITDVLIQLGIKNAVFKIEINTSTELNQSGIDEIRFLFSANKNIAVSEISKIASGGEVSRIMLSLKSLLAKTTNLPTIIFDEIDTGVSGEIAAKMAEIMFDLSSSTQVISITHLPQIAVKGNEQFIVYKDDSDKKSQTKIAKLAKEDRIKEIAKMLSGKELSSAAVENAKALLN